MRDLLKKSTVFALSESLNWLGYVRASRRFGTPQIYCDRFAFSVLNRWLSVDLCGMFSDVIYEQLQRLELDVAGPDYVGCEAALSEIAKSIVCAADAMTLEALSVCDWFWGSTIDRRQLWDEVRAEQLHDADEPMIIADPYVFAVRIRADMRHCPDPSPVAVLCEALEGVINLLADNVMQQHCPGCLYWSDGYSPGSLNCLAEDADFEDGMTCPLLQYLEGSAQVSLEI